MRKLRLSVAVYLFPMLLGFTMVADASCCEGVLAGTSQVTFGTSPVNDGGPFTLALLVDTPGISNPDSPPYPYVGIYPTDLSNMNLTLDIPANVLQWRTKYQSGIVFHEPGYRAAVQFPCTKFYA
jgi:hypothetical protein